MGSTFYFIEDPDLTSVAEWFRALPFPPQEVSTRRGMVLNFSAFGKLSYAPNGTIIAEESPIVTLFMPRVERGILWTVGEVHFRATGMRERFPDLAKISSSFSKWLKGHACVYSNRATDNEFAYYLEGSVKHSPLVYALPSGLAALRSGQYFVGDGDNDLVLESLCRALRLRGVNCSECRPINER